MGIVSRFNKKRIAIVVLLLVAVLQKFTSLYPGWIEAYYSTGIYPPLAGFFRWIFGWLPFSVGDIVYTVAGGYILMKIVRLIRAAVQRRITKEKVRSRLSTLAIIGLSIYVSFNLFWGLNYNRQGIAHQLGLAADEYATNDLLQVTGELIEKVNQSRRHINDTVIRLKDYSKVFSKAQVAYQTAAIKYPFLNYYNGSVKKSTFGRLGNYLGFLGYYNPFSGEAQLNLTQPHFLLPFVSCHEMAHQLGYASESEANFVGYLSAIHSGEAVFKYSAYFDMFSYANRELSVRDSALARQNVAKLDTLVRRDFAELREYWLRSKNPFEPVIKIFYDHYLKANQQANGVKSYNEVVGWLIAFKKKYGHL